MAHDFSTEEDGKVKKFVFRIERCYEFEDFKRFKYSARARLDMRFRSAGLKRPRTKLREFNNGQL